MALVALGLIGLAGELVVLRYPHPAILSQDFVKGLWAGVCLGAEFLGIFLVVKGKRERAA